MRPSGCLPLLIPLRTSDTEEQCIQGVRTHPQCLAELAFLDEGAAQCGFCIPGQLMSAQALLEDVEEPTTEQIQEALAGNLCRCAGYEQIFDAVRAAASASRR